MAVWFDAGNDLFHFLALCVTLMEEFGSIRQQHERTGSKKALRNNSQRYGGKFRLLIQEEECKANQTHPESLVWRRECLESCVVQYSGY